jgi:hypothetical protein
MGNRIIKQLIIGIIALSIVVGLGISGYYMVREKPTCVDGLQNQSEEGVDCGAVCGNSCGPVIEPIKVLSTQLLKVGENDYDFIAQVVNPNAEHGASEILFDLVLTGSGGETVFPDNESYILPGQTRYFIVSALKTRGPADKVEIKIKNIMWEKLKLFEFPSFPVKAKKFVQIGGANPISQFDAVLYNDSNFDFDKIDIGIILFDGNDKIVGVGNTNITTLLSRGERFFRIQWPIAVKRVVRQDVEVTTNFFDNSNFIKTYGTRERFQLDY